MTSSAPPRRARSTTSSRACGSGLGTGFDGAPFRRTPGSAGARRARHRGRADLGGDPRRCRAPRRTAVDARGDPRARSDRRRRRRDRPRPHRHQRRRRGAAAGEDRGGGLGPHDRHCRRHQVGAGARPLSAADRGGAVRPCGDPPQHRGGRSRRRLSGSPGPAARQGGPSFRHRWRALHSRRFAREHPRTRVRSRRVLPPSPAWSSMGCSSAWCGSRSLPAPTGCGSSRHEDRANIEERIPWIRNRSRAWRHLAARAACVSRSPQAQAQAPTAGAVAVARELIVTKGGGRHVRAAHSRRDRKRQEFRFVPTNPNLRERLNEVSLQLRKEYESKKAELVYEVAIVYATHFTEQELKDLVTFYKSPLGQKMLKEEPVAIDESLQARTGLVGRLLRGGDGPDPRRNEEEGSPVVTAASARRRPVRHRRRLRRRAGGADRRGARRAGDDRRGVSASAAPA